MRNGRVAYPSVEWLAFHSPSNKATYFPLPNIIRRLAGVFHPPLTIVIVVIEAGLRKLGKKLSYVCDFC